MRPGLARSLFVVAAVMASGCIAPPGAEGPGSGGEAPVLHVGDHWVQRAYLEAAPNATLGTLEYFVAAVETLETGSGPAESYRIDLKPDNRSLWLRTSDWAVLQVTFAGQVEPVDPPCLAYMWPPSATEWDHACGRLGTSAHNATRWSDERLVSRAGSEQTVTVPAGAFDTVKVMSEPSSGSGAAIDEYFADDACFPARVVLHHPDGPLVLDLLTYQCGGAR